MELITTKEANYKENLKPYFYYKRVLFSSKENVFFRIRNGYNFLVRFIIIDFEMYDNINNYQDLSLELLGMSSRILINSCKSFLICGCNGNIYTSDTMPVDNDNFSVSGSANSIKNNLQINELFHYSEPIQLKLNWEQIPNNPKYVDILLQGVEIPIVK